MPLTGAMICLFLQVVGIPVSWKKLQISCRVDWIGWRLCFSSGTVSLREEKRLRLLECVRSLLRANGRVSVKDLESFLGLSMWACALFPNMRAMLHPFYKDLCSPADTNFSVAPSSWHSIRNFLDDSLRFVRAPPHTAIPVGAKLLSARHVQLCCSAWLIFRRLLSPISAYGFALNASAAPAANYRQPLPAHYMPLNAGSSTSRHLPACALPHMLMSKPLPMPRPKAATAAWVVSSLALPLDKFGSRNPFQSRILRRSAFPLAATWLKR